MNYELIIIYFLFFLILSAKNLRYAVYLVIFTLPAYLIRFEVAGLPMTLLEGEIIIVFLVWVFKTIKIQEYKNIKIKYHGSGMLFLYFYIFIFLLAATISMFISPDPHAAAGIWKAYFLEPILFFIVFIKIIKKEDLKNVFLFFCFSAFVLSVFALYQEFTGNFIPNEFWAAESTRRVTSIFSYPNALALYLAPLVILFLGLLVKIQDTRYKIQKNIKLQYPRQRNGIFLEFGYCNLFVSCFLFFVSCVALAAVYFTKSKGALLAILAGLIFYSIFYKGYRKIFIAILICVFMFLCFYVFVNDIPNLKGSSTVTGGDSISTRLEMWNETWQMLKTRPIFGSGLAGYQQAVAPFHQKDYVEIYLYPHNIILNFWSEVGFLGLVTFILIIIYFYKIGFSNYKESEKHRNKDIKNKNLHITHYTLHITIMSAMTTLLVHGFVDVPYFKNDLAVLFWVFIGVMVTTMNYKSVTNRK